MKNIKVLYLLVLMIIILSFSGCATMKFNLFGIDIKEMRNNAKAEDYGNIFLGAAASVVTHIAGHFITAELFDVDISLDGLNEVVDYSKNPSSNSLQWMARGGFIFQLAVNTILVEFASDSYFTKGFTSFTSIELLSYGIRHRDDGDFNLIDENNGNGTLEYALFMGWQTYNFYNISVKPKGGV